MYRASPYQDDVLQRLPAPGGPRLAAEVIAEAVKAGIPERTLRHAFKAMGGTSERHGRDRGHFVVWELPRLDA